MILSTLEYDLGRIGDPALVGKVIHFIMIKYRDVQVWPGQQHVPLPLSSYGCMYIISLRNFLRIAPRTPVIALSCRPTSAS